jgi:hypothetical protein
VFCSNPRTRQDSEESVEGMWEFELRIEACWVRRRDARGEQLVKERSFLVLHWALGMQHFMTFTCIPVYSLNMASFLKCMDMLVVESVARLKSSTKP